MRYAVGLLLLLGACASPGAPSGQLTSAQSLAVSCRGYAGTLMAMSVWKPAMNAEEIAAVDLGMSVVSPLCRAAARGEIADYDLALASIRRHLRGILTIEAEISYGRVPKE